MSQIKAALKAGLIAGFIWSTAFVLTGLAYFELDLTVALNFYNAELVTNPNALNGMTAMQFLIHGLETSTIDTFLIGLISGPLIVALLVLVKPRYLARYNYAKRGLIVGFICWIIYPFAYLILLLGFITALSVTFYQIFTSLLFTLFTGYVGGSLFSKFSTNSIVASRDNNNSPRNSRTPPPYPPIVSDRSSSSIKNYCPKCGAKLESPSLKICPSCNAPL